jgi:ABC-type multidrug transport system fused ATPase/permease subunit
MLFCAGVVGQEPVLFDFTIDENIRMGRDGCTTEDIEKVRQTCQFLAGARNKVFRDIETMHCK